MGIESEYAGTENKTAQPRETANETRQSIIEAQERAYHAIGTEDFPDRFAAKIMQEYFNELFPDKLETKKE